MGRKTKKKSNNGCYIMDISPYQGSRISDAQVESLRKLVIHAEKNGYRITNVVFPVED